MASNANINIVDILLAHSTRTQDSHPAWTGRPQTWYEPHVGILPKHNSTSAATCIVDNGIQRLHRSALWVRARHMPR